MVILFFYCFTTDIFVRLHLPFQLHMKKIYIHINKNIPFFMSAMQSFFSVIFCLLFVQLLNPFFDIAEWSKKKYSNLFFCTLLMFWLTILFKKTTKIKTVYEHESLKYWCLNAFFALVSIKKVLFFYEYCDFMYLFWYIWIQLFDEYQLGMFMTIFHSMYAT